MNPSPSRALDPGVGEALTALADQVPGLTVWVIDAEQQLLFCRGPWLDMRGLTPAQVLGRPLSELVLPAYLERVLLLLEEALAGRDARMEATVDYAGLPANRRATWEVRTSPLPAADGRPLALLTARDLAGARARAAAGRTNDKRFRAAFDHAPNPMLLLGPAGTDTGTLVTARANDSFDRLVGGTSAAVLGKAIEGAGDAGLFGAELVALARHAASGAATVAVDSWIRHSSGRRVHVRVASSPLIEGRTEDGEPTTELVLNLHDLTRERETEQALSEAFEGERRAAEVLRELNSIRDGFVSAVSHELRTPLTGILGNLEMLLDGDGGPLRPMQALMLATVEAESQRLHRMIEDLLTTARIQAGALGPPVCRDVDLVALAETAATEVGGQLRRSGQELTVALPERPVWVSGDADQLVGVLAELLSNAIKVTPQAGRIHLSCARHDDAVLVSVADTGPGIAEKSLPHVFERFYRTAHAGNEALPGTGLGLALVHHTVTAHGGSVSATSSPEGAVFTVWLPTVPGPTLVPQLASRSSA